MDDLAVTKWKNFQYYHYKNMAAIASNQKAPILFLSKGCFMCRCFQNKKRKFCLDKVFVHISKDLRMLLKIKFYLTHSTLFFQKGRLLQRLKRHWPVSPYLYQNIRQPG